MQTIFEDRQLHKPQTKKKVCIKGIMGSTDKPCKLFKLLYTNYIMYEYMNTEVQDKKAHVQQ